MVLLLLDHGADSSARAADGRNALDFARDGGHDQVIEMLERR
jgi:ankyrin repeat protein